MMNKNINKLDKLLQFQVQVTWVQIFLPRHWSMYRTLKHIWNKVKQLLYVKHVYYMIDILRDEPMMNVQDKNIPSGYTIPS